MNTNPVDPNGLAEFSVVYTDRSLNHMSKKFQAVMNELFEGLCDVYQADYAVLVPGGGTFAMEAVARQLATNQKVLVVRNGWFSFRWTQIIEMGGITQDELDDAEMEDGFALDLESDELGFGGGGGVDEERCAHFSPTALLNYFF